MEADDTAQESEQVVCLCCDRKLPNFGPVAAHVHPAGGLSFKTGGHYGSAEFDPMDGTLLKVVVCDTCISDAIRAGKVHIRRRGAPNEIHTR